MLLLFAMVKAISEVLLLTFLVQSVVRLTAAKSYENNVVYRICSAVTRPVMWFARLIMPRFVLDRYIWMVAVLIIFVMWGLAGQQKLERCVTEDSDSPLCVETVKAMKEREDANR